MILKEIVIQQFISKLSVISPALASKCVFRIRMKKKLNLKSPKTLNEKIMWLKLNTYKNNNLVTQCADKVKVREYVKNLGIENILVPIYKVWENTNDIEWNTLPESFVMKCNHGWGYNIICSNKNELDEKKVKAQLSYWLKTDFWKKMAELNYRNIPRRILCEKYLENHDGEAVVDYKVYCFNGLAKFILVCIGRHLGKPKYLFFDEKWELARINNDSIKEEKSFIMPKPNKFEKMMEYANLLSKPFPFVRVDFYLVNNDIFFGEMTFTPSAGADSARLSETDLIFGEMVDLNYNTEV